MVTRSGTQRGAYASLEGNRQEVFAIMIAKPEIGDLVLVCRLEENHFLIRHGIFQPCTEIGGDQAV